MKRIIYAGDSTVTFNKIACWPQTGLSQGLLLYLKDDVWLRSYAINGRSTRSFIDQGRLDQIDRFLEPGDYLFIQFGHNDEKKSDPARYADPDTAFPDNLRRFIETARRHQALPVLITPLARRNFDEKGHFIPGSHGAYPEAVRRTAREEGVPCIDLTARSEAWLASLGDYASRRLYVYPKDNSHLMMEGAVAFAGFIADGLLALGEPYADLLVSRRAETTDDDGDPAADPYMVTDRAGTGQMTEAALEAAFAAETED